MKYAFWAAAVVVVSTSLPRQLPAQQRDSAAQHGTLRVFLDCSGLYCDHAFYQTAIPFVTHVRDRSDADVHVLVTQEQTGAGGTRYTIAFLGQGRFAGETHTLTHTGEPSGSEHRERTALAQVLKLGLVPYVADTPLASRLQVTFGVTDPGAATVSVRDPWDHWTFRLSGNGFFNGEHAYSTRNLFGSVSASRTTEQWKLRFSLSGSESHSRFSIDSTTAITSTQSSRALSGVLVRSLGAHFSAGVTAAASSSTFLNQRRALRIAPAVEYNFFPYAESTRRQLTFRYSVGPTAYDYVAKTIFGRTSETRVQQSLLTTVVARQPWGSVNVSGEAAAILTSMKHNRLHVGGGVELNLVRGLSLDVSGSYERLRDQLYLAAGEASEEEILLRRRQMATGFRYYGSVGLSYTFGSRVNQVVNPRFGGGAGGFVIFN